MLELNKIYNLPCEEGLKLLDSESIDLTVTSPPYDNLRDYKGYSFDFETIAKELFRVTKKGGVVVWIVGDATINGSETLTSFKQALYFKEIGFSIETMIYQKDGQGATGSINLYWQSFEYMFLLIKGNKAKTINLLKDRQNKLHGTIKEEKIGKRNADGTKKGKRIIERHEFGIRYNIWKYKTGLNTTTKEDIDHPAMFPEILVADHINSWTNENETVLDCFMGSGTTAKVAMKLNRKFIGFEISKEYHELAEKRIKMNVDLFCSDYC